MALSIGLLANASAVAQQPAQPAVGADTWRFIAGIGSVVSPRYPGADVTRGAVVPLFGAQKGLWTLGVLPNTGIPLGVAYDAFQGGAWRAGVALGTGWGKARSASQSAKLRGWGDVPASAQLAAYASYSQAQWAFNANLVSDLGAGSGPSQGVRANVGVESRLRVGSQLLLSAGPSLSWANRRHQQSFFGITAQQSALSSLPTYSAQGGLQSLALNLGANYQFTPQWGLNARASVAQLRGSAADSPLVVDRQQISLSAFVIYRF